MKLKVLVLGLAMVALAVFASPASAQDGPSLDVEPATVDAAGEQEFTITGSGWTAAPPIFVLPCDFPESGDPEDVSADTCDTGNLTPVTPDADGNFEVTVTYDVPAEGIAIAAGDAGQTESARFLVTVGDGNGNGDDDADEEEEEELAETGSETALVAIVGISAVVLGAMVLGLGRRFTT